MACAHEWTQSLVPDYDVCPFCGTYHSRAAEPPDALYGADYWTPERGRSTMREQIFNVDIHQEDGRTKNGVVLGEIEVPDRAAAFEIACAPGTLLRHLRCTAGFRRVVGNESVQAFEADIRDIGQFGGYLIWGLFPGATVAEAPEQFTYICGLDVFEHSPEPDAFLAECARLLRPEGQLFLMGPFLDVDDTPMPEHFWLPAQHVYLHSARNLRALMDDAGFRAVRFGRWTAGHEFVTGRRMSER